MNRTLTWIAFAAASVLAGGCASHTKAVADYAPAAPAMAYPVVVSDSPPLIEPGPRSMRQRTLDMPTSTFSIDVDTGSYAQVRSLLRQGLLPDADAVRTEEFLNYFDYDYAPPASAAPFSVTTEIAPAPWNSDRHLLLIGLQGFDVAMSDLPPANLVFLIDTSGSMQSADRIDLLKDGFRALVNTLRPIDRVAIVAYAGSAGLVLPSTPGSRRGEIIAALDRLQTGGSTDGGAGIALAYDVANAARIAGGINRVILATDGDFNVGTTSVEELKQMVATRRTAGVALTTLGFGIDAHDAHLLEQLADVGDGNYAFVDDDVEARKVLVREAGGTLLTIAKDVKVQVEFDPADVVEYRLLGYDNRRLHESDFADDRVDAGDAGAGHDVTALYEIALAEHAPPAAPAAGASTLAGIAEVRVRFKDPQHGASRLMMFPLQRSAVQPYPSQRLQFAAAVAVLAEKLRGNVDLAQFGYAAVGELVAAANLPDPHGERAELADLAASAATARNPHAPPAE